MREYVQELPETAETLFQWHGRPGALARLVPPWQPVLIGHEASNLRDGAAELRLPAGRTWVAQHLPSEFIEGRRFADQLTSRPFVLPVRWMHRHEMESSTDGAVLTDRVDTNVPGRMLDAMFRYRHRQLRDDLAMHRATAGSPRLTVAMTGASGLVGSALEPFLTTGGHRVIRLVRHQPAGPDERRWDPDGPDPAALAGIDAVVHLAGHSIAGRFGAHHKDLIRSSRVTPTGLLAVAAAEAGVRVFVSASAVGIYGADRGDETLDEGSEPGSGFLADVVRDWEAAALAAAHAPMRVVVVRTGIVQSPRGGALKVQRPLFTLGLGGRLGSGEQWQSWIGIDDLMDVYLRALVDERLAGPVNATAPHPVQQREYAAALGHAVRRPTVVPTPGLGPQLLLGAEGAREVAQASQRVLPSKLLDLGHQFRFPEVEPALRHLLGSA